MKIIQKISAGIAVLGIIVSFASPGIVSAKSVLGEACDKNKSSVVCAQSKNSEAKTNEFLTSLTNLLLYIAGAIAVVVVIIGGFRYITSGGDQTQVTSAKNTILYAVIGLIVALLAYALVRFVLNAFV